MTFGLIMLLLACGCTYLYVTHFRQEEASPLGAASAARLASKLAVETATEAGTRSQGLSCLKPGDFIKFQDVGLDLQSIDGRVEVKHLYKVASQRWYEIVIDQGGRRYELMTLPRDEHYAFLTLSHASLQQLGLAASDFSNVKASPLPEIAYEGNLYRFYQAQAVTFCPTGNELEPEPCLMWHYRDNSETLALSLLRWQDSRFSIHLQAKVNASQWELLNA